MRTQLAINLKQIVTITSVAFAMLTLPVIANAAPISLANLDWTSKGTMGSIGGTLAMPTSPTGNSQFAYVTTAGGIDNNSVGGPVSPLVLKNNGDGSGNQTNGSSMKSTSFNAAQNDSLSMYFNYISTDGGHYPDYAWARLVDNNNNHVAWLFAAESSNRANGNVVPGSVLKNQFNDALPDEVDAVVNGGNTVGFEVGDTNWSPLGGSAGTCWDNSNTCGSTDWLLSEYTIQNTGIYYLELGVMNWGDDLFDSALAIDFDGLNSARFGSQVAAVPVPAAAWLFGSALLGFAGLRRKV